MQSMFEGVTLSIANYDSILLGWSELELQSGVDFHAGDSKYSSLAAEARQDIIANFSWSITDGGEAELYIHNINYTPVIPSEEDTININATVIGTEDVDAVLLVYKVDDGDWVNVSMDKDGDIYNATIGSFAIGENITFSIWANDTSGNEEQSAEDSFGIADLTPPDITDIEHVPEEPTEEDIITFSATVTDNDEVDEVLLVYKIDDGDWVNVSMDKDGDIYNATIGTFEIGENITFSIWANDTSGNEYQSAEDSFGIADDSQIPGYHISILIGLIGVVCAIVLIRKELSIREHPDLQD